MAIPAANRSVRHDDNEPDDMNVKFPAQGEVNSVKVRLANLAGQRKAIADEEKEAMGEYTQAGGTKAGMRFLRALNRMDPDKRERYVAEIDYLLKLERYW